MAAPLRINRDENPASRFPSRRLKPEAAKEEEEQWRVGRPPQVAVVGTGWALRAIVPSLRVAGIHTVAVWGRDASRVKAAAAAAGIPFASDDMKAVVSRADVDVVVVATPPGHHAEACVAAIGAGKAVLVEKPMVVSAEEREAVMGAWKACTPQRPLLVDYELRMLPVVHELRRLVRGGALGTVSHVEARCLLGLKADPASPYSWWFDKEQAGGCLGGVGVHLFDLVSCITGKTARTVSCVGTIVHKRRFVPSAGKRTSKPVTADEAFTAQVLMQADVTCTLQGSFVHRMPEECGLRVVVTGSKGSAVLSGTGLKTLMLDAATGTFPSEDVTDTVRKTTAGWEATQNWKRAIALDMDTGAVAEARQGPSGPFYDGLQVAAAALCRCIVSGFSTDAWVAAGGATAESATHTQLWYEAAQRSLAKRGSWTRVPTE